MKLVKKVYTTSSTENLIDRSFREIQKDKEEVPIKELFKLYERLFFDIPQTGLQSHQSLVEKSMEYLEDGEDYIDTKQQKIDTLNQIITELQAKIADLEMSSQIKDLGKRIEQDNQNNHNHG